MLSFNPMNMITVHLLTAIMQPFLKMVDNVCSTWLLPAKSCEVGKDSFLFKPLRNRFVYAGKQFALGISSARSGLTLFFSVDLVNGETIKQS